MQQRFPEAFATKPCICLFIADDYEYMEPPLVELLREKLQPHLPHT